MEGNQHRVKTAMETDAVERQGMVAQGGASGFSNEDYEDEEDEDEEEGREGGETGGQGMETGTESGGLGHGGVSGSFTGSGSHGGGGAADAGTGGAAEKRAGKPGPRRKRGPVTKPCADARVSRRLLCRKLQAVQWRHMGCQSMCNGGVCWGC